MSGASNTDFLTQSFFFLFFVSRLGSNTAYRSGWLLTETEVAHSAHREREREREELSVVCLKNVLLSCVSQCVLGVCLCLSLFCAGFIRENNTTKVHESTKRREREKKSNNKWDSNLWSRHCIWNKTLPFFLYFMRKRKCFQIEANKIFCWMFSVQSRKLEFWILQLLSLLFFVETKKKVSRKFGLNSR